MYNNTATIEELLHAKSQTKAFYQFLSNLNNITKILNNLITVNKNNKKELNKLQYYLQYLNDFKINDLIYETLNILKNKRTDEKTLIHRLNILKNLILKKIEEDNIKKIALNYINDQQTFSSEKKIYLIQDKLKNIKRKINKFDEINISHILNNLNEIYKQYQNLEQNISLETKIIQIWDNLPKMSLYALIPIGFLFGGIVIYKELAHYHLIEFFTDLKIFKIFLSTSIMVFC